MYRKLVSEGTISDPASFFCGSLSFVQGRHVSLKWSQYTLSSHFLVDIKQPWWSLMPKKELHFKGLLTLLRAVWNEFQKAAECLSLSVGRSLNSWGKQEVVKDEYTNHWAEKDVKVCFNFLSDFTLNLVPAYNKYTKQRRIY